MTLLNIKEAIKQEIPNVSDAQILDILNQVYRDFAHRTRILKKQANLTIVANTVEYTLATAFTDIDGELVLDILQKDSSGELVDTTTQMKWSIVNGVIRFYDFYGQDITSIPSEIATLTFVYVYLPTALSSDAGSPVINSDYHDGLVSGALAKLHPKFKSQLVTFPNGGSSQQVDWAAVKFHKGEYEKAIFDAKRRANEHSPISMNASVDYY